MRYFLVVAAALFIAPSICRGDSDFTQSPPAQRQGGASNAAFSGSGDFPQQGRVGGSAASPAAGGPPASGSSRGGQGGQDRQGGNKNSSSGSGDKDSSSKTTEGGGDGPSDGDRDSARGGGDSMELSDALVNFETVVEAYVAKKSPNGYWSYSDKKGGKARRLKYVSISETTFQQVDGGRYSGLAKFTDARDGRRVSLTFTVDLRGSKWKVVSVSSRR
jgi:hypothetical protein